MTHKEAVAILKGLAGKKGWDLVYRSNSYEPLGYAITAYIEGLNPTTSCATYKQAIDQVMTMMKIGETQIPPDEE